jgi:hypothetical protein
MQVNYKTPNRKLKTLGLAVLVLAICAVLSIIWIGTNLPAPPQPSTPEMVFQNAGLCRGFGESLVDQLVTGDPQYICAELETNEPSIYLELQIYDVETDNLVFITGGTFTSGQIAYLINPPLSSGKYEAKIKWARPALVRFTFSIAEQ